MGSYGEHLDSQIASDVDDRLKKDQEREINRFIAMIERANPEQKRLIRRALDSTLRRD